MRQEGQWVLGRKKGTKINDQRGVLGETDRAAPPHLLGREAGAHRRRKQGSAGRLERALFWGDPVLSDHGRSWGKKTVHVGESRKNTQGAQFTRFSVQSQRD